MIEKDYLINEINNKLESQENQIKRLNEAIKELKLTISKLLEENSKFSDIKDIKEIKTLFILKIFLLIKNLYIIQN